jgi:hypothetical protein
MKIVNALILCVLFAMPAVSAIQGGHDAPAQPPKTQTPTSTDKQQPCGEPLSDSDAQDLERDLAQMRSLIQQMQMNLAAATSSESPLKHQFQLDIDMWQLMLGHLEKRAGTETKPTR